MVDSIKILRGGKPAVEVTFEEVPGGGRRLKYDAHVGGLQLVMTLLAAVIKLLAEGTGEVVIDLDGTDPALN
jgi:hypothetical protein